MKIEKALRKREPLSPRFLLIENVLSLMHEAVLFLPFYSRHSGPAFKEIGDYFDGFDFAAIPIGAFLPRSALKDQHVSPDEAVKIHQVSQFLTFTSYHILTGRDKN